ncbi:hypothetical protein SPBRAN_1612 [uncultured Candidatus Thioglobus sp.]|nr:hypothetical protein SPBRAN_1612 [uncultured Candidatus Thioglobus sp.]
MFCTKCGTKLSASDRFCNSCGATTLSDVTSEPLIDEPQSPLALTETTIAQVNEAVAQVRPWVRYWARMFDVMLFSLPVGLVIGLLFPDAFAKPESEQLLGILILFSWTFVESILLVAFGTTPGKWLFQTRFVLTSGTVFTFSEALSRSVKVWWRGLGIGFPLVSLITMIVAYNKLTNNQHTSWDKDAGIIIKHERIGVPRVIVAITFFVLYFALIVAGSVIDA